MIGRRQFIAGGIPGLIVSLLTIIDKQSIALANNVAPIYELGQWIELDAGSNTNHIWYSFGFFTSESCDSLYALVTITNNTTGIIYEHYPFYGSGMSLYGNNALYVPSGTYNVVVTAIALKPPQGASSYYSQSIRTVYV